MAVLGISLHAVQDFYAHSNWVEDPVAENGRGGPGVSSLGYGETPTWFDVPPEVRRQLVGNRAVYTGVKGIPRGHGNWQSNKNKNLRGGLNKDWPGRPKYQEAYVTAYFATRQWIRAVRVLAGQRAAVEARDVAARHGSASARRQGRRGDLDLQRALAGRWGAVPAVQVRRAHRQGGQRRQPAPRARRFP